MPVAGGYGIGALPIGASPSAGSSGTTSAAVAAITPKPLGVGAVVTKTTAVGVAVTPVPVGAGVGFFETQFVGAATTPVPLGAAVVATGNQATVAIAGTTPVPVGLGAGVGALPSQALYFVIDAGDLLVVAFGASPQVNFVPL